MNRNELQSSVELTPFPESAAARTRSSGVGSSPSTSGTFMRIQAIAGPGSPKPPLTNRYSIAVW
jgi:hypothetical protein